MLLTKPNIQSLQTSFSQRFRSAYRDAPTFFQNFSTTIPSNTRTNTYGWMQRLLAMREWDGPRIIQNLKTHAYSLENKSYEATVAVASDDIKDDMLGVYNPRMEELGRVGKHLPDQLILEALRAGDTENGFDDQAFFSTGHTLDPAGGQDNTGTEIFSQANWAAIRAERASYTGEDGRPLKVVSNLVVIPPQFELVAKQIFVAEIAPQIQGSSAGIGGGTNMTRGEARYLVLPELQPADGWFVFDTTAPIQAMIWQLRESVKLVSRTSVTDDNVFWQKEFVWGLDGRGRAGYGPWWLAYHATGTTAAF